MMQPHTATETSQAGPAPDHPIVVEDQFGISKIGKVRTTNQDAIMMDPVRNLYILADGMGGHRGGEVASAMVINVILARLSDVSVHTNISEEISAAFLYASEQIKSRADFKPELKGMGTTAICAFLYENEVHIGHVGDSRLYLSTGKDHTLFQLTRDHSLVVEAELEEGSREAKKYKNVLTRSVGYTENLVVDYLAYAPSPGDIILLCSDGLTGMVSNEGIEEILKKSATCKEIADTLVSYAYDQGADDNVSVIVLKFNKAL